jgi:sterol desaturase/sphingolipid hydroxylase (fatty acid hydroxylase superfamily)
MIIEERSSPQRIRLFRDDRLERLTTFSPRAFATTWLVIIALAVYASWGTASVPLAIGLILLGVAFWTLFEYFMHRVVFHLKLKSQLGQKLVFLMHGNHHVDPSDSYRNLMPPLVSVALLGAFWALFLVLLGPAGSVVFIGFAVGYVTYDSVHYACHQYPMRGPLLGRMRQHHSRHHYSGQEGNYAITAIFWDRVFGTSVSTGRR